MSSQTFASPAPGRRLPLLASVIVLIPLALLTWFWMINNATATVLVLAFALLIWVATLPIHQDLRAICRRALPDGGRTTLALPPHPASIPQPRLALDDASVDTEFQRIIHTEWLDK